MSRDIATGGNVGWVAQNTGVGDNGVHQAGDFQLIPFTMHCAVNPTVYQDGQDATLLNRYNTDAAPLLRIRSDNRCACFFMVQGNGDGVEAVGTTPIPTGSWSRIQAVHTGTRVRSYYNGIMEGDVAITGLWSGAGRFPWAVGSRANTETGPFIGMLGHVALWDIALNDNELLALGRGAHPKTIRPGHLRIFLLNWCTSDTVEKNRAKLDPNMVPFIVDNTNVSPGLQDTPGAWCVA